MVGSEFRKLSRTPPRWSFINGSHGNKDSQIPNTLINTPTPRTLITVHVQKLRYVTEVGEILKCWFVRVFREVSVRFVSSECYGLVLGLIGDFPGKIVVFLCENW